MRAVLNFKGNKIEIPDVVKVSGFKKYTGLMFKDINTSALLFEFPQATQQPIHSFFCPDFFAIWLDENNKILEYKLVFSNRSLIKPEKEYKKLLEIPLNEKYSSLTKVFLGKTPK